MTGSELWIWQVLGMMAAVDFLAQSQNLFQSLAFGMSNDLIGSWSVSLRWLFTSLLFFGVGFDGFLIGVDCSASRPKLSYEKILLLVRSFSSTEASSSCPLSVTV